MGELYLGKLNPQQFNDGGPEHIRRGPSAHPVFEKSDRALRDHIFDYHTRSTEHGKMEMQPPEGHTFKNGKEWHDWLHENNQFEWRNQHMHR
jgi:hypothetical protein